MTITVILAMDVKDEHIDKMQARFERRFEHTRSFDGCLDLFALQNHADPQTFLIVGTWESREKYDVYFAWRTESGGVDNLTALLEGDLNLTFYDRLGA